MVIQDSPLEQAMAANGTEAGPEPPAMGVDEWLRRLTELPLAFQPGEGWRYHQSFAVLGILISRVTGRPLGEHLAEDVSGPLGMTDTALWVADGKLDRLPAAYRHGDEGLVEIEPVGGGFLRRVAVVRRRPRRARLHRTGLSPLRPDACRRRASQRAADDLT
jgi:CubicO group peptidase (beta-lactamase class C family)